jgi:glycosyltransferase involved in cell wall biosynthesis
MNASTAAGASVADVCVLLTPRALGGHEAALFGWLADAARELQLRPTIVAPTAQLFQACASSGLARWLRPLPANRGHARDVSRPELLRNLQDWPTGRPVLLAPGVLHTDTWLLMAAIALRHEVWIYVPMAYTAARMGYPWAWLRDHLLAPWIKRVAGWITIDRHQGDWLQEGWGVKAPVLALPNKARPLGPSIDALVHPAPPADGRLRVAFVGSFDLQQKGLDWLVQAIQQHPSWRSQFEWTFQGSGPGERALLELACTLGPQHVRVNAHAPLDDALARCDVLLLCSRFEGLPVVALEATARGWPVVASRHSGLQDLLPASSLFDFGDPWSMVLALQSLRTPATRQHAAAHAQAQVATTHTDLRYHHALRNVTRRLQHAPP